MVGEEEALGLIAPHTYFPWKNHSLWGLVHLTATLPCPWDSFVWWILMLLSCMSFAGHTRKSLHHIRLLLPHPIWCFYSFKSFTTVHTHHSGRELAFWGIADILSSSWETHKTFSQHEARLPGWSDISIWLEVVGSTTGEIGFNLLFALFVVDSGIKSRIKWLPSSKLPGGLADPLKVRGRSQSQHQRLAPIFHIHLVNPLGITRKWLLIPNAQRTKLWQTLTFASLLGEDRHGLPGHNIALSIALCPISAFISFGFSGSGMRRYTLIPAGKGSSAPDRPNIFLSGPDQAQS